MVVISFHELIVVAWFCFGFGSISNIQLDYLKDMSRTLTNKVGSLIRKDVFNDDL